MKFHLSGTYTFGKMSRLLILLLSISPQLFVECQMDPGMPGMETGMPGMNTNMTGMNPNMTGVNSTFDLNNCPSNARSSWSFDTNLPNGPRFWGTIPGYQTCGTGNSQSPIFVKSKYDYDSAKEYFLKFRGYDYERYQLVGEVLNRGTNILIRSTDTINRYFQYENDTYYFREIKFYFGGDIPRGEPVLHRYTQDKHNGKAETNLYRMEVHLIHGTLDFEKVAIIAIPYVVGTLSFNLVPIIDLLLKVPYRGDRYQMSRQDGFEPYVLFADICYKNVLRSNRVQLFYVYNGSRIEPPCTENVIYFLSSEMGNIEPEQVERLKALYATPRGSVPECRMSARQYRPIQPINGRDTPTLLTYCNRRSL